MRQAIVTKFIGPTNTRGSRVKAVADAGSVVIYWNHAHGPELNHLMAARALQRKFSWPGNLIGGCLPKANAYHYCFVLEVK